MAKGTITVEVQAETKKATQQIKNLQKDVSSSKGLGDLGKSLKGIGLDGIGGGLSKFEGLANVLGKLAAPAAGIAVIGAAAKGLGDMAERGQEAAQAAEKMNTSLITLSRNFGGTGAGAKEITKELQLMSANGVNSLESINGAMQTLTVAFKGNIVEAGELVKKFDDLAAGTGIQIDDWAGMAAEVMNTGVSIKDLTKLSNKGIPVYQAFASVLGTTAEEAEKMAKAGEISTQNWLDAMDELAKSYKGLSAAMSSQTLEGAQATYSAMRSMQMQPVAEARNQEMIAALNENSEKIQAQLNDPVRAEELKAMGKLAGSMDTLSFKVGEWLGDLPALFSQGIMSVGTTMADWFAGITGDQKTKDVRMQSYASGEVFLPNLAGDERNIVSFIEGKTSGDIQGWLKETENALRNLTSVDLEGFSDKTKEVVAEGIKRLTEQQANLTKALTEVQKQEAEKAQAQAQEQQENAAKEAGTKAAEEFKKSLLAEAMKSGDPEAILKAYFGTDKLSNTVEEYLAGLGPLERMLKSGLGDEEMLAKYKMLKDVQAAYNKNLEEEARAKQKAQAEADKAAIDYKAKLARDLAATQKELDTVNQKIQDQQMAAQEIADEEAHGIYREKWGKLDVSTVKSVDAELLDKQKQLTDKMKELKDKQDNSGQHITAVANSVNNLANSLANRVLSIKAVVDPIRVG